jgi:hypothetical protein
MKRGGGGGGGRGEGRGGMVKWREAGKTNKPNQTKIERQREMSKRNE